VTSSSGGPKKLSSVVVDIGIVELPVELTNRCP
jgi:hypothetical protein